MTLFEKIKSGDASLSLIGLGYVGLPIAVAFAKEGVNAVSYTHLGRGKWGTV